MGYSTTVEWRKWNKKRTKPITNYDRLILKTPDEIAGEAAGCACPPIGDCPYLKDEIETSERECKKCWLDWLKQEAKE